MLHLILPHLKGVYLQCCKALGKKTEGVLDSKNETRPSRSLQSTYKSYG